MKQALSEHWRRYRLFYKILFLSVLGLGMFLGMRPTPPPTGGYSWMSALFHAGGLFVCTLLSYLGFPNWRWWVRGGLLFASGVAVEYVQSFHPTRSADINDIYVNSVGVAAGLIVIYAGLWVVARRRRLKHDS